MGNRKVHYATIKDVANLAGTSAATVSYVLNGNPNKSIKKETIDRIMSAVEELNYSKSAVASSLRSKKRGLVFVLVPQFNNVYYTRVCESIEDVLFAKDIVPVFCDTRESPDREKKLIESAVSQRADGIILGPTSRGWENTNVVRQMNIPLVTIGREFITDENIGNTFYVGDDSYQAGYLAGRALIKNGHRKIGVIEWDGAVSSARERKAGFSDSVKQMENDKPVEVYCESSMMLDIQAGYQLTKRLLQQHKPTALFFGYHLLAQGGIMYIQETGYRIPEDISVILIGTPSWADLSVTPYAVVNQHEDWVGTTAGRIISHIIKGELQQPILMEHRHICPCNLIEHKSIMNFSGKGCEASGN